MHASNRFLSSRCAESHRNYIKCLDEISQSLKTAENNLLEFISQKVTCLADCTDQEAKFRVRNRLFLCKTDCSGASYFPPITFYYVKNKKSLTFKRKSDMTFSCVGSV